VACPEGITRATIIEICAAEKIRCVETDLSLDDVYGAREIFCTGTMGELAAVTRVDDRQIGDGDVGSITTRLSDLYLERTKTEGVQVVDL
jgi:branched-chain amino acid aminotransferase